MTRFERYAAAFVLLFGAFALGSRGPDAALAVLLGVGLGLALGRIVTGVRL